MYKKQQMQNNMMTTQIINPQEQIKKVIFGDSITNFSRYHKNIFDQKIEDRRARFKYFPGTFSQDILHYVN